MNSIGIYDLCKCFHGIYAVENLDLTVPEGAIYGFIGKNGSGKSTTEKMITGLMNPKSGSIKLYGKPPLGFNFIKLGLDAVLVDPKTREIYTPNTGKFEKMNAEHLTEEQIRAILEERNRDDFIQDKKLER